MPWGSWARTSDVICQTLGSACSSNSAGTLTLPICAMRPRSLRSKSTIITFSARSLALLRRCSAWAASCAGVVPRAAVPFMGRVRMLPLPWAGWCQSKNNSGETDSSASCPMSKKMLKPPGCACCSAANKAWRSMGWGLVPWYVWVRLSW